MCILDVTTIKTQHFNQKLIRIKDKPTRYVFMSEDTKLIQNLAEHRTKWYYKYY